MNATTAPVTHLAQAARRLWVGDLVTAIDYPGTSLLFATPAYLAARGSYRPEDAAADAPERLLLRFEGGMSITVPADANAVILAVCKCAAGLLGTTHHTPGCPQSPEAAADAAAPTTRDVVAELASIEDFDTARIATIAHLDARREVTSEAEAIERANIIRHAWRELDMSTTAIRLASGLYLGRIREIVGLDEARPLTLEEERSGEHALPFELPSPRTKTN